jgi:hypothetical protein
MTHDDSAPLLCGTAAGYIRHIRARETACEDCRAAHTLYVRLWRARGGMESTRLSSTARSRALVRLGRMHPTEYRALYLEEREKLRAERAGMSLLDGAQ